MIALPTWVCPPGFGLRQSSGALVWEGPPFWKQATAKEKSPEDWRSPKRCREQAND